MRGSGKFCSSFWSPTKFISVTLFFRDGQCMENGNISDSIPVSSSPKQGCVLAPTLVSFFFLAVLAEAFCWHWERSIYLVLYQWKVSPSAVLLIRDLLFFKWLNAGNFFSWRHLLKQWPFCWAASQVGFMTEQQDVHVHPVPASLQSGRGLLVSKNAVTEAADEISHCTALHSGCGHTSVEQHCETK